MEITPEPTAVHWRTASTAASFLVAALCVFAAWSALQVKLVEGQKIDRVQAQAWNTIPTAPRIGGWQDVKLPQRLCKISETPCYDYLRTTFRGQANQMAVYVPRFVGSVRVMLNGSSLGDYGSIEAPVDLHFVPKLTRLPMALVQPNQPNHLDFIVTNEPGRYHQLNELYIGTEADLQSTFAFANYVAADIPTASIGIYLTLGLLSVIVFALGGRDPMFGWFALIALFSGMRSFYFASQYLDPFLVRGGFYFIGSLGGLVAIYIFSRHLVVPKGNNASNLWIISTALVVAAGVTVWDTLNPEIGNYVANTTVRIAAITIGVAVTWNLARYFKSGWSPVKLWSLTLFLTAFAFVIHDTIPPLFTQYIPVQLSNLSPLFVVMAFCLIAGQRFGVALNRSNAYNLELASEISRATAQIEIAYSELTEVREREAILEERHRIMREVHDGIGGKLAGVLYMARNPEMSAKRAANIAEQVEESLLDLRSIIDALDNQVSQDFGQALRNFESKITPWLQQYGLAVNVTVEQCSIVQPVSSSWLLSVFRLLQESVSNVVRHANATTINVRLFADTGHLRVQVADNGMGYDNKTEGRGLTNMKERCLELGGSFSITGSADGTDLSATIPIIYDAK